MVTTLDKIEQKKQSLQKDDSKDEILKKNDYQDRRFKLSVYEKMLRPEPNYMKPIRKIEQRIGFLTPLRWINIILISAIHFVFVSYCIHNLISPKYWPYFATGLFGFLMYVPIAFGVTVGAHRYWCHRSFKAKLPLQWILLICYSMAGMNSVYEWVKDHRVHHKYSETTADPHDAKRGFFFAHMGWLMMKKHPDVVEKGNKMDFSDITNDPLLKFHNKYFVIFKLASCFVIPTLIPVYGWGETWLIAIITQCVMRYLIGIHITWSVNSFAHIWGNKPYDEHIMPVENWMVSFFSLGEGWHNYHHTFPWDYKAAELGRPLNGMTTVLNMFKKIGWAYDMKEASPSLVRATISARRERHNR